MSRSRGFRFLRHDLTCFASGVGDDGPAGTVALAVPGAHLEEVLRLRLHVPDDGRRDVAHDGLDEPLAVLRPPVDGVLDHVAVDAAVRELRRPPREQQGVVLVPDRQVAGRRPGSGLLRPVAPEISKTRLWKIRETVPLTC